MRVNSAQSIKLGESIYKAFGSWRKAREAATLTGGVYVLPIKEGGQKPKPPTAR